MIQILEKLISWYLWLIGVTFYLFLLLSNANRQCDIVLVEKMKGSCIFYKFYLLVYFENYPTRNF